MPAFSFGAFICHNPVIRHRISNVQRRRGKSFLCGRYLCLVNDSEANNDWSRFKEKTKTNRILILLKPFLIHNRCEDDPLYEKQRRPNCPMKTEPKTQTPSSTPLHTRRGVVFWKSFTIRYQETLCFDSHRAALRSRRRTLKTGSMAW